jgi:hypothetical protein
MQGMGQMIPPHTMNMPVQVPQSLPQPQFNTNLIQNQLKNQLLNRSNPQTPQKEGVNSTIGNSGGEKTLSQQMVGMEEQAFSKSKEHMTADPTVQQNQSQGSESQYHSTNSMPNMPALSETSALLNV